MSTRLMMRRSMTAEAGLVARSLRQLLDRMAGRLRAATAVCRDAVATEMRTRRDVRRLREMPDRMLQDLGLHRSDITAAVRQGGTPRRRHRRGP